MNCCERWYCSHCGKKQDGGRRRDVFLVYEGLRPIQYRLCDDCAAHLSRWMEGEVE